MKAGGCDAVVLECVETPLLMDDANSPLPTLDRRGCSRARRRAGLGG